MKTESPKKGLVNEVQDDLKVVGLIEKDVMDREK